MNDKFDCLTYHHTLFRSGVKSEGDTIVIDEKAVKTEKDAKTKE